MRIKKIFKPGTQPVKGNRNSAAFDRIGSDYDGKRAIPIRPFDLRQLGYLLDVTDKVNIGSCELRRVLNEDTKREASFSYLLWTNLNVGVILPKQYSHYTEGTAQEADGGSR